MKIVDASVIIEQARRDQKAGRLTEEDVQALIDYFEELKTDQPAEDGEHKCTTQNKSPKN